MTKIDLITGFLGSGKTTFLKLYADYLINRGEKIGILENDYGAVNVDMMLLSDLEGDSCKLEMVSGGCCSDCHSRRFKTKLIALGMSGLDRVVVEPSGIFDVDEFFDALQEEPLNHMYEIGNVIAIVDANLDPQLSDTSTYYLASQIASAGVILLSKSQLVDTCVVDSTIKTLYDALSTLKVSRNIDNITNYNNWSSFTDNDFEKISTSGYNLASYTKSIVGQDAPYSSVYFLELPLSTATIKSKIRTLFESDEYGSIFRIKGFYQENDEWFEVNSTRNEFTIKNISNGQDVLIVIGENLVTDKIEEFMKNKGE